MNKILAIIASLVLQITATPIYPTQAWTDQGVFEDMHRRAESIINYEWTPMESVETWNGSNYQGGHTFQAGQPVKGVPYTLFYDELEVDSLLSLAQFMDKAPWNQTATEYCYSVEAMRTGPVYGSCCATFISEVYGGQYMDGFDPIYDSVTGIKGATELGWTRYDVKAAEIYPGDALSTVTGGHIIWVSQVADEAIVIYEQAPPVARRVVVDRTNVDENGYLIYNGSVYNTATRSNALLHDGIHVAVEDPAVEPTCEEIGFTQGSHCGNCGLTMLEAKVIPATGHTNKVIGHRDSTPRSDGYDDLLCQVCGVETRARIPGGDCAGKLFKDIADDGWYHDSVDEVVRKGLMNGISTTEFGLEENITRGQLVMILYRMAGSPQISGVTLPYEDVPPSHDAYEATCWAYSIGLMKGMTETAFAPEAPATREQIVTMLYRIGGFERQAEALTDYPDWSAVSDWATEAVTWAVEQELLTGARVGGYVLLRPQDPATRGQMAVLLSRYMQTLSNP